MKDMLKMLVLAVTVLAFGGISFAADKSMEKKSDQSMEKSKSEEKKEATSKAKKSSKTKKSAAKGEETKGEGKTK